MPLVSLRNYVSLAVRGPASRAPRLWLAANGRWHPGRRVARRRRRGPGPAAVQRSSASGFFWPATAPAARWPCASPCATRSLCRRPLRSAGRFPQGHSPLARLDAGSPLAAAHHALPRFADLPGRPRLPGAGAVSRRRHVGDAAAVSLRRRADDADAAATWTSG